MSLAYDAMIFSLEAHKHQVRKYTGNRYADHLAEVAGIVSTVAFDYPRPDAMLAISWGHDLAEDQDIVYDELFRRFGVVVADGIWQLSDLSVGERAKRKADSRTRLAKCEPMIQTIKVADVISNTSSIARHDPKFAVTYFEEKRLLLDVLTKADARLVAIARAQIGQV